MHLNSGRETGGMRRANTRPYKKVFGSVFCSKSKPRVVRRGQHIEGSHLHLLERKQKDARGVLHRDAPDDGEGLASFEKKRRDKF
jgi:hypothetical protein